MSAEGTAEYVANKVGSFHNKWCTWNYVQNTRGKSRIIEDLRRIKRIKTKNKKSIAGICENTKEGAKDLPHNTEVKHMM